MLILERSLDQRVHVYRHGTRIGTVLLQRLGHNRAWLGFEFSGEFEIVREEVDDREGTLPLHSDRARHRWTDRQLDSIYWEYPRKRSGGLITMRAAIAVSLDWLVENARNDLKTAPAWVGWMRRAVENYAKEVGDYALRMDRWLLDREFIKYGDIKPRSQR